MSYIKLLIANILKCYILSYKNSIASNQNLHLKVLPFQALDHQLFLKSTLKFFLRYQNENNPFGKTCFLIELGEDGYQAVIVIHQGWHSVNLNNLKSYLLNFPSSSTEDLLHDEKINLLLKSIFQSVYCEYIYTDKKSIANINWVKVLNAVYHRPRLQMRLVNFSSEPVVVFTEIISQLLIQGNVTNEIDETEAYNKHHKICIEVAHCKLKEWRTTDLYPVFYDSLIRIYKLHKLTTVLNKAYDDLQKNNKATLSKLEFRNKKIEIYDHNNLMLIEYLTPLSYEILFEIIFCSSLQDLITYLAKQSSDKQISLRISEKILFSEKLQNKIVHMLEKWYQNTSIGLGAELTHFLLQSQVKSLITYLVIKKYINNHNLYRFLTNYFLKIIGGILGVWYLSIDGFYSFLKPVAVSYVSNYLSTYLQESEISDRDVLCYKPKINYRLDSDKWILITLILFGLGEALYNWNKLHLISVALIILFRFLFTELARLVLPSFRSTPHHAYTEAHRFTLIYISMLSDKIISLSLNYYNYARENKKLCKIASDEIKNLTMNNTIALQIDCSSSWSPRFWTTKTLRSIWTSSKHKTYIINCKLNGTSTDGIAECEVEQKITTRLLS